MTDGGARLLSALEKAELVSSHEHYALRHLVSASVTEEQAVRLLDTVSDGDLTTAVANLGNFPFVDLDQLGCAWRIDAAADGVMCRKHGFLPLVQPGLGSALTIATATPEDLATRDTIQHLLGRTDVEWVRVDTAALARAICRAFPSNSKLHTLVEIAQQDAIAVCQQMLEDAVVQQASDLHVQPESGFARLRIRIDGVLETAAYLNWSLYLALCVRIKVLAELDVADTRSVQDGRFSARVAAADHRFRVSVMPTEAGESIVLRVLLSHRRAPSLDELGLDDNAKRDFSAVLQRRDGLLLMAGPTGSGKTTTLHAVLERMRCSSQTILTLEDPVEYTAPWLRQTTINAEAGLQYHDCVRAALRQDPDVLLIGEMRDPDSARMAFRASMTGHRVLSTVHANSAISAVSRLRELGLSESLLASELAAVVAQRLMRRLCPECSPNSAAMVPEGVGCSVCAGRGYKGRFAVVEVLNVSDGISAVIECSGSSSELQRAATASGYRPLADTAWQAVCARQTSVEEYKRVIGQPPGMVSTC